MIKLLLLLFLLLSMAILLYWPVFSDSSWGLLCWQCCWVMLGRDRHAAAVAAALAACCWCCLRCCFASIAVAVTSVVFVHDRLLMCTNKAAHKSMARWIMAVRKDGLWQCIVNQPTTIIKSNNNNNNHNSINTNSSSNSKNSHNCSSSNDSN